MKRQNARVLQLSQCVELIQTIAVEIRYGCFPVGDILRNAAQNEAFSALSFLRNVGVGALSDFANEWRRCVEDSSALALKPEEKAILIRFGKSLGTTDTQTQLILCERYRSQISGRLAEAAGHSREFTRLTLGVTAVSSLIIFALIL